MPVYIVAILVASMEIVALVFLFVAFFIYRLPKMTVKNTESACGTLICFRLMSRRGRHDTSPIRDSLDVDYGENSRYRHPIVRFAVNGTEYTERAELPNPRLSGGDIGSQFKIRYTGKYLVRPLPGDYNKQFRVIFDDNDSWRDYNQLQNTLFGVFISLAAIFFILGGLALIILPGALG